MGFDDPAPTFVTAKDLLLEKRVREVEAGEEEDVENKRPPARLVRQDAVVGKAAMKVAMDPNP